MIDKNNKIQRDTRLATLQGPRFSAHILLVGIAAFLLIALLWAYFAVIDEVTVGEGKVIPSSKVQVVQNLEGGIVSDILVKEGDIVKANQIIMHIDDTRFSSSYNESQLQAAALKARVARLEAETNARDLVIPSDLEQHEELIKNEQNLYLSRQQELQSRLNTLMEAKQQKIQELVAIKTQVKHMKRSHTLLNKELQMTKPLVAEGAASEVEVLRLERQSNDLQAEISNTQLAIPRTQSEVAQAESRINEIKIQARTLALDDLNVAKAELNRLEQTNLALADRFERTAVRSPVRGTVKTINVATIGGVVQPGMDLVEIVPLDDSLLIEARIRPSDIGFLHPGQEATVKISAYDFSIYGGMPAVLEHISADTITDEKGESYYQIRVRTTQTYLGKENKPLTIIPGMFATVDILTGQKTVMDYLLKPVLKAQQNALRER